MCFRVIIAILCIIIFAPQSTKATVVNDTYNMLDTILISKKEQLTSYCDALSMKARTAENDSLMRAFFFFKRSYYQLQKSNKAPEHLKPRVEELKANILQHYVHNYLIFYDILFIDNNGDIFYTMRKQADYHKNIFSKEFEQTSLSKWLQSFPDKAYVDFQYYHVSNEPSAFIIRPVYEDSKRAGWFVFQCAINKINDIFLRHDQLGSTGEVIIVNKDHYLLTNSRFNPSQLILKERLPYENITSKFKERKGHKTVIDYRGNRVLTSFEVCNVLGSEWLIIAKINEDEILTNFFSQQKNLFTDLLNKSIKAPANTSNLPYEIENDVIEVDMNEYRRAANNEILYTHGVSTCTAVLITYPKKFSYLAHVSESDMIYGANRTDLITNMMRKITEFEIYPSEKQNLKFYIIAPHQNSLEKCVNYFIRNGYYLSQIVIVCNDKARYANVFNNYGSDKTIIQWKAQNDSIIFNWDASNLKSLGSYAIDFLDKI